MPHNPEDIVKIRSRTDKNLEVAEERLLLYASRKSVHQQMREEHDESQSGEGLPKKHSRALVFVLRMEAHFGEFPLEPDDIQGQCYLARR